MDFCTVIRLRESKIGPSQPARVDFKLEVGSVEETVTVEGAAALLNSEDGSVGTLVGRVDEIENLPLNAALLNPIELCARGRGHAGHAWGSGPVLQQGQWPHHATPSWWMASA